MKSQSIGIATFVFQFAVYPHVHTVLNELSGVCAEYTLLNCDFLWGDVISFQLLQNHIQEWLNQKYYIFLNSVRSTFPMFTIHWTASESIFRVSLAAHDLRNTRKFRRIQSRAGLAKSFSFRPPREAHSRSQLKPGTCLSRYTEVSNNVQKEETVLHIEFVLLDCAPLKFSLLSHCNEWQNKFTTLLREMASQKLAELTEFLKTNAEKCAFLFWLHARAFLVVSDTSFQLCLCFNKHSV